MDNICIAQPKGACGDVNDRKTDCVVPFFVSVRCDCPACAMEWVIVSTIDSGHLEVGYGGEEGFEEACLVG